jgi:uncharacterized protein YjbJ (UPF0337 family)
MAESDKMQNKADELKGIGKEKAGALRGDESQQAEGKKDQRKANVKQAGEKAKDAFKN